ncbi:MAG: AAA family ATPase, partial [Ilumatobacteraceae bacterium]|nr:AAA family ATPase [Ilumatobacteraceae bacterium]
MTEPVGNQATGQLLRLPLLHVPVVLLPGAVVTLPLVADDVRRAVDAAAAGDGRIVLTGGDERTIGAVRDERTIGVIARVPDTGALPTGEPAAIVHVDSRARIVQVHTAERGADHADVELLADPQPSPRVDAMAREARAVLGEIAALRRSRRLPEILRSGLAPGALADAVGVWADGETALRERLLVAVDVERRLDELARWAKDHLAELQVAESIRSDVSEGVDRQQREYLLRQQLAAIRKELGEGDDSVVADYRSRLEALEAPQATKVAIAKEIDRLERTGSQSPEHSWIRTWLDRVLELPWGVRTDDTVDLAGARDVLDADHDGLDDVKDRIVEFLATRALRRERGVAEGGRGSGAIVTLVGPPGVGKTSLGESIARAMGRRFVRVALGGVRDEAEIRGHRRTYVGSQPGRIVRAITEAGSMNPVVLLDEVDKLSAGGWSGDPTAALLEVLDPAQNHTFRDHYLEVDLDLSEVVFIATANVADGIPGPLLDRMDLVRLDGYTEEEKLGIATRHLLPRQLELAGLRPDELVLGDGVVAAVARGYTREAGVRSLERELGRLVRKVTAKVATGAP